MNTILLRGTTLDPAAYSHESHGQRYCQLTVATTRLSGAEDHLRVLIPEPLLELCDPEPGDRVAIEGTLRSFNNKSGQGSRLVLSALAKSLAPATEPSENRVELSGTLCKEPVYRRTPLGREICDLMLASPRPYGRADYLPIIAWGACARACAGLNVGDAVSIVGRFQSRKYIKVVGEESLERTAYEVSAVQIDTAAAGERDVI
jgi:single-stranded DNA-binding protein